MPETAKQKIGLRERKKAKTMASVQMHALRLFQEKGYHATTVEQIAEAAEISPSTFFRYFATKEDVVLTDNYDPLLVDAFDNQSPELSPLQAVRNAMISGITEITDEEWETTRQRNQLIMAVPELRAAAMNNLTQMMHLLTQMVAKRLGRSSDDPAIRTFGGVIVGVNISLMDYSAEVTRLEFAKLLEEALEVVEKGLIIE
ncbi:MULTISPECIES: acyl-CoA-like ligand-binding transcription factor [Paenibacillus]|uniref:TetR family transcriptional regulator n=1 Tax=Paenibacillus agri TaxID=2744309 RepID=A0A850ETM4_9BACL|nr:TetR family transcriptional regulator [Paenibacillus agri]NUU63926.1 TetR family transcriptional regulator [Paenibacillus agri]